MKDAVAEEKDEELNAKIQQFLTFVISGENYGIGILHIKEIIEYGVVTPVPIMPNFIAGVINLRGAVVPVINMANRFQLEPTPIGKKTSVIVIEIKSDDDTLEVGIVVDMVNEVLDLRPDQISPAPKFGAKIRADFIHAMGKMEDGHFIILLDVNKVLSVDELSDLQNATDEKIAQNTPPNEPDALN